MGAEVELEGSSSAVFSDGLFFNVDPVKGRLPGTSYMEDDSLFTWSDITGREGREGRGWREGGREGGREGRKEGVQGL